MSSLNERVRPPESGKTLPAYLQEFVHDLERAGFHDSHVTRLRRGARHFLTWLDNDRTLPEAVDDAVLQRFSHHKCTCPSMKDFQWPDPGRRSAMLGPLKLVRFLEERGHVRHPGELQTGFQLLESFLEHLLADGFRPSTITGYRHSCGHFLVWVHQIRLKLEEVDSHTVSRFLDHDCLCLGAPFRNPIKWRKGRRSSSPIQKFLRYLAERGVVSAASAPIENIDASLPRFRAWLRRHRDVSDASIRIYCRNVFTVVADLGEDTALYTAKRIRDVMLRRFAEASAAHGQNLTTAMRLYLRFLSSTGECRSGLVGAVPTAPSWRLSAMPRYLPPTEIARAIASCDTATKVGLRDRAILLLLARLGLRAGDIVDLRLSDIDWRSARINVCGKSRRPAGLPLAQDVGDALLDYVEQARPRADEKKLFLRVPAPHRPFRNSGTVSAIANRALRRAGIAGTGPRGARVFRHSAATALLRGGATLDIIGALLRHRAPNTTAIYAKVDVAMLLEVAEPWIGDAR